jgi:hypothetical protein
VPALSRKLRTAPTAPYRTHRGGRDRGEGAHPAAATTLAVILNLRVGWRALVREGERERRHVMASTKWGLWRYAVAFAGLMVTGLSGCGDNQSGPPASTITVVDGGSLPPLSRVCMSDTECKGKHCDPLSGCVDCLFDSDCGSAANCRSGKCEPKVVCSTSADCKGSAYPICSVPTKECVRCLVDKDCGKNELCNKQLCESFVPCVNTLDCHDQKVCDRDRGACVGCVSDADCDEKSTCVDSACVPRCTSDKECSARSQLCDTGRGHCVQCVQQVDCPEVYHCSEGRCAIDVCRKGEQACGEGMHSLLTCNLIGDGFDSVDCGAAQSCVQTNGKGECKPWVCTPGALRCDDANKNLERCSADGLRVDETTDCSATGKVCSGDQCRAKICEPGAKFCDQQSIYQCSADGASSILGQACGNGRFCDANVQCAVSPCTALSAICNLNVATTCKADGSGPAAGGTDCALDGKVCDQATCKPKVCEPGTSYCKNGGIYRCSVNGASESETSHCLLTQFCDSGVSPPVCSALKCTPSAAACNVNVVTTCNSDGSGYVAGGTDCTLTGKVCTNATCLPKICEPSAYFCSGGNVNLCGSTGATSTLVATCFTSQFCKDGLSFCQTDLCTAGTPTCNGDVVATCLPDGSGPGVGGTDCTASAKVCFGGACKDVVCTDAQRFCKTGSVYLCTSRGTTSQLYATCALSQFCDGTANPAACRADICTANGAACSGETLAVCNADGSGYASSTTDCSASSQVCSLVPSQCGASAVDTVGSPLYPLSSSNVLYGQFYTVTTSRKLTQIEDYFTVSGTSLFTWVVYSSTQLDGAYAKAFEVTTSSSGTAVFASSGAISVSLEQGKYYFIGALVAGAHTAFYTQLAAIPVSFGQATSGSTISATTAPATVTHAAVGGTPYFYDQRLTTTKP